MNKPELIFVTGCNAAGKSTFIRTRLNELNDFEILMADVYKGRTKELTQQAITRGNDIIVETVFNDESFKNLVDLAHEKRYHTSLVVLFLDSPAQSLARVAMRKMQQSGITISSGNVKINFNESFKNIATYFFYFDRSDFFYTGKGEVNQLIMSFQKSQLQEYHTNELSYPQKFASYSFPKGRLSKEAHEIITANKDFKKHFEPDTQSDAKFKL